MTLGWLDFWGQVAQIVTAVAAVVSSLWAIKTSINTSKQIQMRDRAEAHAKRASKFEDAVSIYFASIDALKSNRGGGSTATSDRYENSNNLRISRHRLELLLSKSDELEQRVLEQLSSSESNNYPRDDSELQQLRSLLTEVIDQERKSARQLREAAK